MSALSGHLMDPAMHRTAAEMTIRGSLLKVTWFNHFPDTNKCMRRGLSGVPVAALAQLQRADAGEGPRGPRGQGTNAKAWLHRRAVTGRPAGKRRRGRL